MITMTNFWLDRSAQTQNIQRSMSGVGQFNIRKASLPSQASDVFFSGRTEKQKEIYNKKGKIARENKKNRVAILESLCRQLNIDPDTLCPPIKTLPPLTGKLTTEKEKKDRHNLVEKNSRKRRAEYIKKLEEVVLKNHLALPSKKGVAHISFEDQNLTDTDAPFEWDDEHEQHSSPLLSHLTLNHTLKPGSDNPFAEQAKQRDENVYDTFANAEDEMFKVYINPEHIAP